MSKKIAADVARPRSGLPTHESAMSRTTSQRTADAPRVRQPTATSAPTTEWCAEIGIAASVPVIIVAPPASITTSIAFARSSGSSE